MQRKGQVYMENKYQENRNHPKRRRTLSVEQYVEGVLNGDRATIARAITLVESNSPKYFHKSQEVLRLLMPIQEIRFV